MRSKNIVILVDSELELQHGFSIVFIEGRKSKTILYLNTNGTIDAHRNLQKQGK